MVLVQILIWSKCWKEMLLIKARMFRLTILLGWKIVNNAWKKQCWCQSKCPISSLESDGLGEVCSCLVHLELERPCSPKRLLHLGRQRFSMSVLRHFRASIEVNRKNWWEFCFKWPGSTPLLAFSWMKSMLSRDKEEDLMSAKLVGESRLSSSFKWTVPLQTTQLELMKSKLRKTSSQWET